jgi:hypothetical protein
MHVVDGEIKAINVSEGPDDPVSNNFVLELHYL